MVHILLFDQKSMSYSTSSSTKVFWPDTSTLDIIRAQDSESTNPQLVWWKWASLSQLHALWCAVPEFFVIGASTRFAMDVDSFFDQNMIDEIYKAYQKLWSEYVAVRSSATCEDGVDDSFAWQFDTYLFVAKDWLLKAIYDCYTSLQSDRIVSYCKQKKIDTDAIGIAIVVQRMIDSDVSWVMFTQDPLSTSDTVRIEWCLWLGEALVWWIITPDSYLIASTSKVNNKPRINKNIHPQYTMLQHKRHTVWTQSIHVPQHKQNIQKVSDEFLLQLYDIWKNIEKSYGFAVDVERTIADGQLYILQARPVTASPKIELSYSFMRGQKQSAMIAEAMILNFDQTQPYFVDQNICLTEWIDTVLRQHKDWFSYIYFGDYVAQKSELYQDPQTRQKVRDMILDTIAECHDFVDSVVWLQLATTDQTTIRTMFVRYAELLVRVQTLYRASDPHQTEYLEKVLQNYINPNNSKNTQDILSRIVTPIVIDMTQQDQFDRLALVQKTIKMWQKSLSQTAMDEYIAKYPANFVNVRSRDAMYTYLQHKFTMTDAVQLERECDAVRHHKKELESFQLWFFETCSEEIVAIAQFIQFLTYTRLELKHCWSGMETLCLEFFGCIADMVWCDVTTLMTSYNLTDINEFLSTWKTLSVKQIQERNYSVVSYEPQTNNKSFEYMYWEQAKEFFENRYTPPVLDWDIVGGCAQPGYASWKVKIVTIDDVFQFQKDCDSFEQWDVLVTTMTSPMMVQLAQKASAIITDEWWVCSHAAIIARELWIPCVVWTKIASKVLKTGDVVEVYAHSWVVRVK